MASLSIPPPGVFRLGIAQGKCPAAFPLGLGGESLHEVCEAGHGDMSALTGFALTASLLSKEGGVVWVGEKPLRLDHGHVFETGIRYLGKANPRILHVEARKPAEALWAAEEAIRSRAAGLVIAELSDMDFTASRRLTLASGRHGTPGILLMPYTRQGATASAARWRISARPSAPNRYDSKAPGHPRWQAVLERSRQAPHMAGRRFELEFNDETLSLTVVSGLASDAAAPRAFQREDAASSRKTA